MGKRIREVPTLPVSLSIGSFSHDARLGGDGKDDEFQFKAVTPDAYFP